MRNYIAPINLATYLIIFQNYLQQLLLPENITTYIDLNTLAEFVYVLLQRRRTDVDIRAVLARTANRLESDAFQIQLQIECEHYCLRGPKF